MEALYLRVNIYTLTNDLRDMRFRTANTLSGRPEASSPPSSSKRDHHRRLQVLTKDTEQTLQGERREWKRKVEADKDKDSEMKDADEEREDDVERIPVPDGIDLTRVPWDASWMQSLLTIDKSLEYNGNDRRKSTSVAWIEPQDALDTLTGNGKEEASMDDLFAMLSLES
jgi:hypothetical protein